MPAPPTLEEVGVTVPPAGEATRPDYWPETVPFNGHLPDPVEYPDPYDDPALAHLLVATWKPSKKSGRRVVFHNGYHPRVWAHARTFWAMYKGGARSLGSSPPPANNPSGLSENQKLADAAEAAAPAESLADTFRKRAKPEDVQKIVDALIREAKRGEKWALDFFVRLEEQEAARLRAEREKSAPTSVAPEIELAKGAVAMLAKKIGNAYPDDRCPWCFQHWDGEFRE